MDVVFGGEVAAVVVRLSRSWTSQIENAFLLLKYKDRNYPIRGVPDTIEEMSYCTVPKGWIDSTVMLLCFKEGRVFRSFPSNRRQVLYVGNCSGHVSTDALMEAVSKINGKIKYFP